MGCGCSSMKGFGAFGAAGDSTALIWWDYNPAGSVRVMRNEALVELRQRMENVMGGAKVVAIDPKYPDLVKIVAGNTPEGVGETSFADWVKARVAEGKKVGIHAAISGKPNTYFPVAMDEIVGEVGSINADTILAMASKDEQALAREGAAPAFAIIDGYSGFAQPGGGGGGEPSKASIWSGPVPWLIGGAVVLGIGAFALSKKKG